MPRLTPCPSCHVHVFANERACPHCGASLHAPTPRVPALLVGLALTGCPEPEPVYGVPDSGTSEDSDSTADTGTDGSETNGSETDGSTTGNSGETAGEPDYGVPDSG